MSQPITLAPDSALRCVHSQYRDFRFSGKGSEKPIIRLFCNIRGKSIRRNQETCALTCPYYERLHPKTGVVITHRGTC